jgi:hypothetical protein
MLHVPLFFHLRGQFWKMHDLLYANKLTQPTSWSTRRVCIRRPPKWLHSGGRNNEEEEENTTYTTESACTASP